MYHLEIPHAMMRELHPQRWVVDGREERRMSREPDSIRPDMDSAILWFVRKALSLQIAPCGRDAYFRQGFAAMRRLSIQSVSEYLSAMFHSVSLSMTIVVEG